MKNGAADNLRNERLQIAAQLLAGFIAKGVTTTTNIKHALKLTDELIKMEQETVTVDSVPKISE